MKRLFSRATIIFISVFMISMIALYFWIKRDVQHNINIAERNYNLKGEEALLLFLEDENNPPIDRTHIAIWTLGKIRSKKALPILKTYYTDDPKGLTCKNKHHEVLCQYEIHKALMAIENGSILSYTQFK